MEPTLCKGIMLSDSVIREHCTGKLSLIGCFTTYSFPILPSVAPARCFPKVSVSLKAYAKDHYLTIAVVTASSPFPAAVRQDGVIG